LSLTVAFWFFIAAAAPHRVHHFFEQFPKHHVAHVQTQWHSGSEHDSHHDRHQDKRPSPQNDCVVLSVAQNTHASVVQSFSLAVLECAVARRHERHVVSASSFNPAPFSQRAPPPLA
jgi:hypothetical protein